MLVTVPEAARRVGRNPETVRRWIRAGRLRSEKLGTQHFVHEEEVLRLASDDHLELPDAWRKADHGPMPPWEQLVRDGRDGH